MSKKRTNKTKTCLARWGKASFYLLAGWGWAAWLALGGIGCRGELSSQPPVHLNPNMDNQAKFLPQAKNPFFEDKRAMRGWVPGTVAVGHLKTDDHLYQGRIGKEYATTLPSQLPLSRALLQQGQDRFNIYCRSCHDGAGTGQGIVVKRGMSPVQSYHQERLYKAPLGYFYHVVNKGLRNMPSLRSTIPPKDIWAIVAYIRALQLARNAQLQDIPKDIAIQKGWGKKK